MLRLANTWLIHSPFLVVRYLNPILCRRVGQWLWLYSIAIYIRTRLLIVIYERGVFHANFSVAPPQYIVVITDVVCHHVSTYWVGMRPPAVVAGGIIHSCFSCFIVFWSKCLSVLVRGLAWPAPSSLPALSAQHFRLKLNLTLWVFPLASGMLGFVV